MRANVWSGRNTVQVENVPDPKILNDRDAIVKITSTAICGSDLHLYDGYIPTMKKGDILGHEFMGEVVETGRGVDEPQGRRPRRRPVPDRLRQLLGVPARALLGLRELQPERRAWPRRCSGTRRPGIFGYSHLTGGYAGGQAEYARVPFADVGPIKIEDDLPDEQVLFLSDIFPTGYMGAEFCDIKGGEVDRRLRRRPGRPVRDRQRRDARRRAGDRDRPVRLPARRWRATRRAPPTTINFDEDADVVEQLKELTGGRGPGRGHRRRRHGGRRTATASLHAVDRVKQATRSETDRGHALRDAILACRPGGIVSIIGVYGGLMDKFPTGALMNKGLTIKTGQCHVQRYLQPLYERIRNGDIDPSFVDHPPAARSARRPTATRPSSTSRTSA